MQPWESRHREIAKLLPGETTEFVDSELSTYFGGYEASVTKKHFNVAGWVKDPGDSFHM